MWSHRSKLRRTLLACSLVLPLLVAGCRTHVQKIEVLKPANAQPEIADVPPIRIRMNNQRVRWEVEEGTLKIDWVLEPPPAEPSYTLPASPPPFRVDCPGTKTCRGGPATRKGKFKYTITVTMPAGTPSPPPLDPDVVVMD